MVRIGVREEYLIDAADAAAYAALDGLLHLDQRRAVDDRLQRNLVLAALGTLVSTYGIEFNFRPYMDQHGNLKINVDLGYPALGQPYPASGLVYNFPGNLLDYAFVATGSTGALPPCGAALANAVPRTVRTSLASRDSTVAMALPA